MSHAIIHRTNGDSIETSGPRLHGKRNRNRNCDRIVTEIVTVIAIITVMSPTPPSRRPSHARGMSPKRSATSAAPALAVALSSHGDK